MGHRDVSAGVRQPGFALIIARNVKTDGGDPVDYRA